MSETYACCQDCAWSGRPRVIEALTDRDAVDHAAACDHVVVVRLVENDAARYSVRGRQYRIGE